MGKKDPPKGFPKGLRAPEGFAPGSSAPELRLNAPEPSGKVLLEAF